MTLPERRERRPESLTETTLPAKPAEPPAELRPEVLFPLWAPAASLPGVGPSVQRLLARLLNRPEPRCLDLLRLLPRDRLDPTPLEDLRSADPDKPATLAVEVIGHEPPASPRHPWRVKTKVPGGELDLVFFNVFYSGRTRFTERFAPGTRLLVHGRLGRFRDRWQMPHPELLPATAAEQGRLLAIYPAVEGLGQARLRSLVGAAIAKAPDLPEWLPADLVAARSWPSWKAALQELHQPSGEAAAERARSRLALDELTALQLAMALVRRERARAAGRSITGDGRLRRRLLTALPFSPTRDQTRTIEEIAADMATPAPMSRLLQGDVGSGKTLVALAAMLIAVEAGAQAALMAPTELLARQHQRTLSAWLQPLGLDVGLLVGSENPKRRAEILERLAAGDLALVVGTHALLEPGVGFADLALAVIDEQHRFGVHQRLTLLGKGRAVDLLLTTATPIPRSLVLALYGDLAVSSLREKPAGRRPIDTRAVPARRLGEVLEACGRVLERGSRVYWICPAIDDEDTRAAAETRFQQLRERFGEAVGLAHGRMKAKDRDAAMRAFAEGRTRLLVATTVVEVGVDVPEATLIVIEGAERFGLAQLHQLRGRVGRGEAASSCLLVYDQGRLSAMARQRLATLRATDDGFAIAEADLELRGPGEVLGVRQSGMPEFVFADLAADQPMLKVAQALARRTIEADPTLSSPHGRALRLLLHLFERHEVLGTAAAAG